MKNSDYLFLSSDVKKESLQPVYRTIPASKVKTSSNIPSVSPQPLSQNSGSQVSDVALELIVDVFVTLWHTKIKPWLEKTPEPEKNVVAGTFPDTSKPVDAKDASSVAETSPSSAENSVSANGDDAISPTSSKAQGSIESADLESVA